MTSLMGRPAIPPTPSTSLTQPNVPDNIQRGNHLGEANGFNATVRTESAVVAQEMIYRQEMEMRQEQVREKALGPSKVVNLAPDVANVPSNVSSKGVIGAIAYSPDGSALGVISDFILNSQAASGAVGISVRGTSGQSFEVPLSSVRLEATGTEIKVVLENLEVAKPFVEPLRNPSRVGSIGVEGRVPTPVKRPSAASVRN
jgi:hypothetical protein